MSVKVVYTTSAVAVGGRDGNTGTTDGRFEVEVARPKELGDKRNANHPEQLFASPYAASFVSSLRSLALQGEAKVPANAEVMSTVGYGPRSEGDLGIEITLPGVARREAEALIEKAHQVRAYSNATRNNLAIKLGRVEA